MMQSPLPCPPLQGTGGIDDVYCLRQEPSNCPEGGRKEMLLRLNIP